MPKANKSPKKTDKQIEVTDIADLLVAIDKRVQLLEQNLKDKTAQIARLKERLGI